MTISAKPNHAGKFSRRDLPNSITYYQSQGITLKGTGAWRDAVCPFHKDTNPSLRIKTETGAYRCFVCGARGGDVLAFHMHRHSMGFVAAAKELGAWRVTS
jgi:DNA primase